MLLQIQPQSVSDAFWLRYTRDVMRRWDFLQFWPSLYADFMLLQRHADGRVKLIFLVIYGIKIIQMSSLLFVMRNPQHLARFYGPHKRNIFVLIERALRVWSYAMYLGPIMLGEADVKGLASLKTTNVASFLAACKLLILLSGGVAAFWHTTFMSLPWAQEVVLVSFITLGSLFLATRPTAELIASWSENTPLHIAKHYISGICELACFAATFLSAGWSSPMCRSAGAYASIQLAATYLVFVTYLLPVYIRCVRAVASGGRQPLACLPICPAPSSPDHSH